MPSKVEQYRRLPGECLQLANLVQRPSAMAHVWQRLAHEQDGATDLRPTKATEPNMRPFRAGIDGV